MNRIPINFFKEDIAFRISQKEKLKKWIAGVIRAKGLSIVQINYVFCSDKYLLKMNKEYLRHNFFTDIMTFDYSTEKKKIEADIFISYQRVKINAATYKTTVTDELHRVMIHGVLHLLGYKDKTGKDRKLMRKTEDEMLAGRF